MYVLNEYMEFGVDTHHIATYNFKLVFHLLFSTIYSISLLLLSVFEFQLRVPLGNHFLVNFYADEQRSSLCT